MKNKKPSSQMELIPLHRPTVTTRDFHLTLSFPVYPSDLGQLWWTNSSSTCSIKYENMAAKNSTVILYYHWLGSSQTENNLSNATKVPKIGREKAGNARI
jgi:hypothetical protein